MSKVKTVTVTAHQAISISQIILDESNYLTFWGHLKKDDGWHPCDFVTTYEVLNAMLRYAQDTSDDMQMSIVKRLEEMHQIPEMIDLEAELGHPVVFSQLGFSFARPRYQQQEDWVEYTGEECYFIEKVTPIIPIHPPTPAADNTYEERIHKCMDLLYKNYELYLGYLELEFEEETARVKSDLTDDLKYTMAYCAWQKAKAA